MFAQCFLEQELMKKTIGNLDGYNMVVVASLLRMIMKQQ